MNGNLYDILAARFPADRASPAIELPDGRVHSYGDLEAASARLAHGLEAAGARLGDRLMVQVEKTPEAVFLYLACLHEGTGVDKPDFLAVVDAERGQIGIVAGLGLRSAIVVVVNAAKVVYTNTGELKVGIRLGRRRGGE